MRTLKLAAGALALVLLGAGCGGSIETRLAEIKALHDAGEFSSSVQPLRALLSSDPDHPEANYLLGVALVQTRQPSLAVWPLRKAADTEEYGLTAGLLLASTLMQMSGFEEAIKAADGVLRIDPDSMFAIMIRANANVELGALEEALVDADRVLELEPDSYQGFALKAMALTKLERFDQAEATILRLNEAEGVKNEPALAIRACVALAVFYRENEQAKAGPAIENCLEQYPGEPFVLQEAEKYFDGSEQPERATELWRKAAENAPEDFSLQSMFAQRLVSRGKAAEAESVLATAAEAAQQPRAWDQLARFYQSRNNPSKAREALEKAIQGSTGDTEDLRFRQADLLVSLGELDEAQAMADQLKEAVYGELIRGRILISRGEDQAALDTLESALTRWPNNAAARFLAGGAAERLGLIEKALSHYRESVRADSEATDAALAAARLALSVGRFEDADVLVRSQIDNRATGRADALQIAIRSAVAEGRFEAARRYVNDLTKIPGERLRAVIELAGLRRVGKGPEAAAKAIQSSDLDLKDPDNALALRSLVEDLVAIGRADEALAQLDSALRANPGAAFLMDLRGRVLYRTGKTEAARAALEQSLAADAEFGPALAALGRLSAEAGDPDAAIGLLDRATAANPEDSDSAHLAAKIQYSLGKESDGEARLRALIASNPGHAGACNDLAWQLAERGSDLEYALKLAQRAARLDPQPDILDTLGWVQLKRGDAAAAAATFEKALAARPEAASVRYRLGLALKKLNRPDDALEAFRAALTSDTFPEAAEARSQLSQLEAAR